MKKTTFGTLCRGRGKSKEKYIVTKTGYTFEVSGRLFGITRGEGSESSQWVITDIKSGLRVGIADKISEVKALIIERISKIEEYAKQKNYIDTVLEFQSLSSSEINA